MNEAQRNETIELTDLGRASDETKGILPWGDYDGPPTSPPNNKFFIY